MSEVERIEVWHREEMEKGYTSTDVNYIKAGFDEISNDFGYLYSVYNIAKGDPTKYQKLLKCSVVEVYKTTQLSNRVNKSEKLYHNLKQGKL